MTQIIARCLVLITILTQVIFAQTATVRFDQPNVHRFYAPEPIAPATSKPAGNGQSWDNFQFAQGEKIVEFQWEGGFLDIPNLGDPQVPPAENIGQWEISIWSDNNGLPGSILYSETRPASEVTRVELPSRQFSIVGGGTGYNRFRFFLTLSEQFEAEANQTYWISPVYHADFDWPEFGLHGAASSGNPIPQNSTAAVRGPVDGHVSRFFDGTIEKRTASNLPFALKTLPVNDADEDGLDDDWEQRSSLKLEEDDSLADPDNDSSTNLEEFERGTDPNNPDTDGDGLLDGYETGTGVFVDETETGTSPLLEDSDRDGLLDSVEDPRQDFVDIDQPGTDPNNYDSDEDEYGDLLEIKQGLDPLNGSSAPSLNILSGLIGGDLTDPEDDGILSGPSASGITFDFQEADNATSSGTHQDLYNNQTTGFGSDWATEVPIGFFDKLFLWSEVAFERPIVLEHFTLTSSRSNPQDDPVAWEIQGSNDGIHFETIFHRTDPDNPVWNARSQTIRFDAGVHYLRPAAYKVFRFSAHNHRDTQLTEKFQLGEIELFGTEATLTVTNSNDSGEGSFRQAINDCPENGIITFDPALSGATIILEGDGRPDELAISKSLTVDASSLSQRPTLTHEGVGSIINVDRGVSLSLVNLNLIGGSIGITNLGELRMSEVEISENGRAVWWGVGVCNSGLLSMDQCIVSSNLGWGSGGIFNSGSATISNSTIANNRTVCPVGEDPRICGDLLNSGSMSLDSCTVVGSVGNQGAAKLEVSSSTVIGTVKNEFGSFLTITDSIFSAPQGSSPFDSSSDWIMPNGTNLISDLTGSGLTEGPNLIVADPRLAPLGDYGGPTPTMPPLPGSPAINSGGSSTPGSTDQRGFPIVGQRDLGAVEYQGDADFARVFDVDYDKDGNILGIESALGTDPFTSDQNHPDNLGAPIFNGAAQPVLTFGLGEDAHPDTTWILERSTDLVTFEEIYAFDGTSDFASEGLPIEVNRTAERITITDQAPPVKGAYYRFRASLADQE